MKLIVGLGNPGEQYEGSRHNVGFQIIDAYAAHHKLTYNRNKFGGVFYKGEDFIIAKPTTYMNLSGDFVQAICAFYKIAVEDVLVIYDDMDFEPGKAAMRPSGSGAGHNGIKDIMTKMGTESIQRIRVGIGRPRSEQQAVDYVLGRLGKEDKAKIDKLEPLIVKAIDDYITKGFKYSENIFNSASA